MAMKISYEDLYLITSDLFDCASNTFTVRRWRRFGWKREREGYVQAIHGSIQGRVKILDADRREIESVNLFYQKESVRLNKHSLIIVSSQF